MIRSAQFAFRFFFAALLCSLSALSYGYDYPAVIGYTVSTQNVPGSPFASGDAACSAAWPVAVSVANRGTRANPYFLEGVMQCRDTNSSGSVTVFANVYKGLKCTNGGTLQGTMCIGGCEPPTLLQPDGTCKDPDPCKDKAGNTSTAWYTSAVGQPSLDSQTYCEAGCSVALNPAPTGTAYKNKTSVVMRYQKVELGVKCTNGASLPPAVEPAKEPPEPPKKPPCDAAEGVLTSTSGKVACVPSGVPSATPPVVEKSVKRENFPDGSSKETDVIKTTDPSTGASDSDTRTTNTPSAGGGDGQAGPVGTGDSNESSSSDGDSQDPGKGEDKGDCTLEPDAPYCKHGELKQKGQFVKQRAKLSRFPG